METLLESIRAAVANDASEEARVAGTQACRTILAALEAKPGEPLATGSVPTPSTPPIANIVAAMQGLPIEQLMDVAIARLRAALPASAEAPRVDPLKFHIIQFPGRKP